MGITHPPSFLQLLAQNTFSLKRVLSRAVCPFWAAVETWHLHLFKHTYECYFPFLPSPSHANKSVQLILKVKHC